MKKVSKLVLRSYAGPLVLTFFIALFVLLMQFLWKWVDELVGKGLEWNIVGELLFYASATFVPLALPLAILLASLMTFGNLGERYELVAMKAAGISLRRIMMPLVVLSVAIAIGAFFFSNIMLPIANLKFRSILYDVRQQKLALNIPEGIYYNGIDGYTIRVGQKEKDEKTLHDIMIYDHSDRTGNTSLTMADSGLMEITPDKRYMVLTLFDGINYYEDMDRKTLSSRPFRRIKFTESKHRFDLSAFSMVRTDEELFRKNYQMLNIRQLEEATDSLKMQKNGKTSEFATNFLSNYSHFRYKYDTTGATAPVPDSVYHWEGAFLDQFTPEQKLRIIENALNATRNIRVNIGYQKDYVDEKNLSIIKHRIEWQRKFTLSFACVILFFVGAPLGAIIRKGGLGLPLVVSVILFVMYHIISTTGFKYAREGVLTPFEGMWLASAVFLPIGIFLTYKATTDSPLMDTDSWKKLILKIISVVYRNKSFS
ncbi:MAG TPA: LptF/LptG family permease [Bacteroidales bacterium]|nr:LptF/LptG family permease [Bacteroidales bacterium]HNS45784.1 LptF/LptG family permease [Bacteroidales bacterium]